VADFSSRIRLWVIAEKRAAQPVRRSTRPRRIIMKLKATTLFLGMCVAVLAAKANPAYARSTTAFSAFHVEINTLTKYPGDPYLCLFENNGAVVNYCDYTVDLEFDLPIDSLGTKSITVQDGWGGLGKGSEEFTCQSFAYSGTKGSSNVGTKIGFTRPNQSLTTTANVSDGATSIQVLCNVPAGDAVANFGWAP
jgi:hypothetical protein